MVVVLKKILDRNLIDLAIEQLRAGRLNPAELKEPDFDPGTVPVMVITYKKISETDREHILKELTKNISGGAVPDFQTDPKLRGGMIIKVGTKVADFSLIDRLRRLQ